MRQVTLTLQGPMGYNDRTETYSEDDLLLTATGQVKPVRQLRERDVLITFPDASYAKDSLRWTIVQIEWVRKSERRWA